MDKYTIELTYEELRLVARALATEEDRLDAIKSDKLKDIEPLEDRIHTIYMDAKRVRESERAWINAERDRTYGW